MFLKSGYSKGSKVTSACVQWLPQERSVSRAMENARLVLLQAREAGRCWEQLSAVAPTAKCGQDSGKNRAELDREAKYGGNTEAARSAV